MILSRSQTLVVEVLALPGPAFVTVIRLCCIPMRIEAPHIETVTV